MPNRNSNSRKSLLVLSRFVVLSLWCASQTFAAISVDNNSSNGASDQFTGLTSISWTHTVNNTCSNCVLYVGVSTYTQVEVLTPRVQKVTYGPQTLVSVGSQVSPMPTLPAVGNSSVELFRLVAPITGSATITVTFLTPVNYAVGNALSFNGVSQFTPNGAFVSSSANSASPALTVSGTIPGDLVLDVVGSTPNAGFMTENPSQSACTDVFVEETCTRGRRFFATAFDVGAMSRRSATAASVPMNWTLTSSASWAIGGIAIKPFVTTAAGVYISGRVLSQKGIGVGRAYVNVLNSRGEARGALTNPFGYYRIDDIPAGETYVLDVSSKRFRFAPRLLDLSDNLLNVDIIAESE